jgi:DNA-binding MurR/RpiR family transcriptional regulator
VRERILGHVGSLTERQRVLAEFLLQHLDEVPFLSVPDLAERSQTSEATVVRFCQRVGFSGYSDLKMTLVDELREELHGQAETPPEPDATQDPLLAVARLDQRNIERSLETIDRREFRAVASRLFRADHVYTFGLGVSAHLADYAVYLFTHHGLRSTCLATRYSSPREQLVVLRPTDLLLAFSFPPYSRQTLEVLDESRERGVPTVVITDRATAPAAGKADHALVVSTHGMTFNNSTAASNVVLNALVVELATRHRGETVEALAGINRALRERSYVIDDDR